MNNLIILTPDCEERLVYRIENQDIQFILKNALRDLSSYVEVYNPKLMSFNLSALSPLKGIKSKNNNKAKTSVKVSCYDYEFECTMYSHDRNKMQWCPMSEDYMQLDILKLSTNQNQTLYAVKNLLEDTENCFDFFNDQSCSLLDTLPLLDMLSHEISLKINYLSVFKQILTMENSEDFKSLIDKSVAKEELLNNENFLFSCLTNYTSPVCIFHHMLEENIIKTRWKNGQEFIESLLPHTKVEQLYHSLADCYNSFILCNKLEDSIESKLPCSQYKKKKI